MSSRIVAESSASASGFPAASRRIRSRTEGASSGRGAYTMSRASPIAQRLQRQLVDTGRVERRYLAIAQPDHHHERIGAEAAGDERERIGGRAVEPLDVVGDDEDRRAGGRVREQRERREGDQEWVVGRSLDEAERARRAPRIAVLAACRARPGLVEAADGGRRRADSSPSGRRSSGELASPRPGPARRPVPAAPTCRSRHRRGSGAPRRRSSPWRRGWRRSRSSRSRPRIPSLAITGACSARQARFTTRRSVMAA